VNGFHILLIDKIICKENINDNNKIILYQYNKEKVVFVLQSDNFLIYHKTKIDIPNIFQ